MDESNRFKKRRRHQGIPVEFTRETAGLLQPIEQTLQVQFRKDIYRLRKHGLQGTEDGDGIKGLALPDLRVLNDSYEHLLNEAFGSVKIIVYSLVAKPILSERPSYSVNAFEQLRKVINWK